MAAAVGDEEFSSKRVSSKEKTGLGEGISSRKVPFEENASA